jgi:predicted MFS family arabinose efflux permease
MARPDHTGRVSLIRAPGWGRRSGRPGDGPGPAAPPRVTFRAVFAVREFRALWVSQVLSMAGDRLALVGLALLVYGRTRSPLLAAVAYAAGTVPYAAGSLFLARAADRFPRRDVMVLCDLSRVVLVAVMLMPRLPVWALLAILYIVTTIQPVFDAARSAVIPDMVGPERYPLAAAVMQTSFRVAVLAGTAVAGLAVAALGARTALGADAATFALSALLLRFGTRARPAADSRPGPLPPAGLAEGARLVFGDPALRTLVLLGYLAAVYSVPSGIAGPYAASIGGGSAAAGLLIAASPAGAALATPAFTRLAEPATRLRWMGPMAACGCAALTLAAAVQGLAASLVIFAISGSFGAYQATANPEFVKRLPDERRAQAFGIAAAGVVGGQGIAFVIAGAISQVIPPAGVIAGSGALGTLAAIGLAISWRSAHAASDAAVARLEPR